MKTDEIKWTGDLQRVSLKPGDVLVLKSEHRFTVAQIAEMSSVLGKLFPEHKCIILEQGMQLGVVGVDKVEI